MLSYLLVITKEPNEYGRYEGFFVDYPDTHITSPSPDQISNIADSLIGPMVRQTLVEPTTFAAWSETPDGQKYLALGITPVLVHVDHPDAERRIKISMSLRKSTLDDIDRAAARYNMSRTMYIVESCYMRLRGRI